MRDACRPHEKRRMAYTLLDPYTHTLLSFSSNAMFVRRSLGGRLHGSPYRPEGEAHWIGKGLMEESEWGLCWVIWDGIDVPLRSRVSEDETGSSFVHSSPVTDTHQTSPALLWMQADLLLHVELSELLSSGWARVSDRSWNVTVKRGEDTLNLSTISVPKWGSMNESSDEYEREQGMYFV